MFNQFSSESTHIPYSLKLLGLQQVNPKDLEPN